MKIGIMQPYFWPYLGYFQLINAVDIFVIYDNIKYTKKGWFNRNRYLCNGTDKVFSIPLKKDSDFLDVRDRRIASDFDKSQLKNKISAAYSKAPYFESVFSLFCKSVDNEDSNLFEYIFKSVKDICAYLQINTEIVISSTLTVGNELKGKDRVIAICRELNGEEYVNPIGGLSLYDKQEFQDNGIELFFIKMNDDIVYTQLGDDFVPALSILDVLMFNPVADVQGMLNQYTLI